MPLPDWDADMSSGDYARRPVVSTIPKNSSCFKSKGRGLLRYSEAYFEEVCEVELCSKR